MSGGFKPPEPVWLAVASNVPKRKWPVVELTAILLITVLGMALGVGLSPVLGERFSQGDTDATPQAAPVGTCFHLFFSVDFKAVEESGGAVPCTSDLANYRRVERDGDNTQCAAKRHGAYQIKRPIADQEEDACLLRLFKVGQCSPITTPAITDGSAIPLGLVVPCDATPTSRYPALARVTKVVNDGAQCPRWSWPTDSEQRHICVRIVQ